MKIFDFHKMKVLRVRHGMTQEQLAVKANMTKNFIGNIERGNCNMTLTYLYKLAIAFGVEPSTLLLRNINSRCIELDFINDECKDINEQIYYMIDTLNEKELIAVYQTVKTLFDLKLNSQQRGV